MKITRIRSFHCQNQRIKGERSFKGKERGVGKSWSGMVGSNSLNTVFFFINQLYLGLIPIRLFCIFLYKSFLFQSFFKCFLKRFSKEVVYILRIYIFYCCFQDFEYISHVRNIYIRICKCTCRSKTGSLKVVTFTFYWQAFGAVYN